jgi:hypothetical protein
MATPPPGPRPSGPPPTVDELSSFWSDVPDRNAAPDAEAFAGAAPRTGDNAASKATAATAAADASSAQGLRPEPPARSAPVETMSALPTVAVVAAAVLELALIGAWVTQTGRTGDPQWWLLLAGLHGLAVLACVLAWWSLPQSNGSSHGSQGTHKLTLQMLSLSIAALGPLGLFGGALATLLQALFSRRGVAQDAAWLAVLSPAHEPKTRGRTSRDLASAVEDDPMVAAALEARPVASAFADVLAHGTSAQKQDLLAAVARGWDPAFAPTLKRALNDRDATVRMLAAAASTRVENEHLDRSIVLEAAWAESPQDAQRAFDLAQHYDRFANTGLLDADRATQARERALEMYQIAGEHRSNDPLIMTAIIRLLVRLGRDDEALALFRPLIDAKAASPALTSWFLESLYRRRRYTELRRYSALLAVRERSLDDLPEAPKDAIAWWAREASVLVDGPVELVDEVDDGNPRRPGRGARSSGRPRGGSPLNLPYFVPRWAQ